MKCLFNKNHWVLLILLVVVCGSYGAERVVYSQNFETATPGAVPDSMVVLDGKFSVKEEKGNRYLELQGVPLDNYAILFDEETDNSAGITARVRGESTGKRLPSFSVGLYGTAGFSLRVSPGRRAIELFKGNELIATTPFEWKGDGKWIWLKLKVINATPSVISGEVWYEDDRMQKWQIKCETAKAGVGKAFIAGIPFSSKPIHFDDITLVKIDNE
ncbi:MAG: hypothetical protein ACP5T0_10840 [Verrucomicrobiia bacterium]